jgi:methionyl-tRNA formyltransferase
MRIGYFADGPWGVQALTRILGDATFQVSFLAVRFQSPDQHLRTMAAECGLPLLEFPNVNAPEVIQQVAGFGCDLFVSMSFDQIFKKDILHAARLGIINCHAGDLPRYRGRNVINWALINGEEFVGVTVHAVDQGIDTGPILRKVYVPVAIDDDYPSILEKCYPACASALYSALCDLRDNPSAIAGTPQSGSGFYCVRRTPADEGLDWNWPSLRIHNFIRGITRPAPGARTHHGAEVVRLWKSIYDARAPRYVGVPGSVVESRGEFVIVKTGDSHLKIVEWSRENGDPCRLRVGDRLGAE